ncbi:hypothetical protein [Desulfosediminicola sp.]|uniref:hypothetical protein n=1 Tax=Desulfosediminicola sp. TaxID=2886825 RepID=UPI003AF272D6
MDYFHQHGSTALLAKRNVHTGSLLTSERAAFYLNILYRILLFKRDYELEPLYDDIYNGVHPAQITLDQNYSQDQFRSDIRQLALWDLVDFRIEKQRLRGYRDNRKRKFRYRLKSEAIHFLEWLEQRCLDDMQSRGNDTRDLLGETRGCLGELLRLLHSFKSGGEEQEDTARRVLFQLFKAGDLCQEISASLADFNGRLLFFLIQHYQIEEVRKLILEIDSYVETFLKQTYSLRVEIVPFLERLLKGQNANKIMECHQIMEAERLRTPNLLQSRRNINISSIPENLLLFFKEQGGLERLLQRINNSSMHVWQKLRSHLRELERKNNRLQDIRYRIEELARLPENDCTLEFITELLSQPQNSFDPNYWDNIEKAEPPEPRKRMAGKTSFPKQYLSRKKTTGKPVASMDETRLKMLLEWIQQKIPVDDDNRRILSAADFDCFEDFIRVIELARAGLLADGKRLARLEFALNPEDQRILLSMAEQSLCCPEMVVSPLPTSSEKPWK